MTLVEIVIDGISIIAGGVFGSLLMRQQPKKPKSTEPTCTGYRSHVVHSNGKVSNRYHTMTDCEALRSPTCMDGRCTLHCSELCACDKKHLP